MNLKGPSADQTVEKDLQILTPYFSGVQQRNDGPPRCDVLLLYCEIDSSGSLKGSPQRVREIIRDSGATIAIIATNNPPEHYSVAIPKTSFGFANIVFTIDRKGPLFASFFARLFAQMKDGISMPIAWNNLAPQYAHATHEDVPATICALERGQVVFENL